MLVTDAASVQTYYVMPEILNPCLPSTSIADRVVSDIAHEMVSDPLFREELSPELLDDMLVRSLELNPIASVSDVRRLKHVIGLTQVSRLCIRPVMSDGFGRAGEQIAGEVCRLKVALGDAVLNLHDDYYSQLLPLIRPTGFWNIKNGSSNYPTIDGLPMSNPESQHRNWVIIINKVISASLGIELKVLSKPLQTRDGVVFDETSRPQFLIKNDPHESEYSDPLPKVLAGL